MLTDNQKVLYLKRLNITEIPKDPRELLAQLHLAHLYHLPFENLDITFGRKISLSEPKILHKLLEEKRGGFCYELNYGFYLLLLSMGFKVQLLSARVLGSEDYGPEFDHLMPLVEIEGKQLLVDVGVGDSFLAPISIDGTVHHDAYSSYKVEDKDGQLFLMRSEDRQTWQPQYQFTLRERILSDFTEMCDYQQTSPKAIFTQRTSCSIATPDGRLTLTGRKLVTTSQGKKTEQPVNSVLEYHSLLKKHFDVVLPTGFDVESWFNQD
ncbi:putative Arylamine N-acetyltransferase [Vibrio nigripulchritudo SOn1]|uniref:Arylamine N-acetyltransferase n=1 Tax=Vibrio nigripulchritudo SOn1 TaxID=1238450 RepID=A0AAV2VIA9_9VIBR|nr:arylamine N-acetyltransferase [Vibrio nigripulchritudo]CCO44271.1 putative Arylamine N-acetyltransferase [Vibrio nigripulchritudo SOn1]